MGCPGSAQGCRPSGPAPADRLHEVPLPLSPIRPTPFLEGAAQTFRGPVYLRRWAAGVLTIWTRAEPRVTWVPASAPLSRTLTGRLSSSFLEGLPSLALAASASPPETPAPSRQAPPVPSGPTPHCSPPQVPNPPNLHSAQHTDSERPQGRLPPDACPGMGTQGTVLWVSETCVQWMPVHLSVPLSPGKFKFGFECVDCAMGTFSGGREGRCKPWAK